MSDASDQGRATPPRQQRHVVVVVLGDVGRSPRMQYHALSLLDAGHKVSLVGYVGEDLVPDLCNPSLSDRFSIVRFRVPSPPILRKSLPLYLIWRIVSLCLYLIHALFVSVSAAQATKVDCVVVQNPPALPLLVIAYFYCKIRGARLVIDWHNLGFSMLGNPLFALIARQYERLMAPFADGHLCVTKAMKLFLEQEFEVPSERISVLYDCPPTMFQPLSAEDQHTILIRLHDKLCQTCPRAWYENLLSPPRQTLFTELTTAGDGQHYRHRPGRPALVTSSTSWTPDEDFGQLLEALVFLDRTLEEQKSSLQVLVVVTGKGPQKSMYEKQMSRLTLTHIAIQTIWLKPADYPRLLACADVGISLHTSTSGLDLPMKVLDLFGCHVPVLARNFNCLSELVEDDKNGRTFETSSELSAQLFSLLQPMAAGVPNTEMAPHSYGELAKYSKNLEGRRRWSQNWTENAAPILIR
jgi:beta-1,4-mannosyltransferase